MLAAVKTKAAKGRDVPRGPAAESGSGSRRRAAGYGLVWLLIFSAACAIGATLLVAEERTPAGESIVLISCGVLAVGLAIELLRSLFDASKLLAFLGAAVAALTLAVAAERDWWDARTLAVLGGALAVSGLCLAFRRFTQSAPSPWPNYLRDRFGADAVRELHGVQLVIQGGRRTVHAGERFELEVFAQNCFDAPRTLTIAPRLDGAYQPGREPVQLAPEARLVLEGGKAGKLSLHCVAAPGAVGEHAVRVRAKTSGSGGVRRRRWRAPVYSDRVPLLLDLLALFSFSLGTDRRGVSVRIDPSPATSPGPGLASPGFSVESW